MGPSRTPSTATSGDESIGATAGPRMGSEPHLTGSGVAMGTVAYL